MKETIFKWVEDNLPWEIIVIVVAILGLMYFVWWSSGVWHKVKKVDTLPCSTCHDEIQQCKENYSSVSSDVVKLQSSVDSVKLSVDKLPCPTHDSEIKEYRKSHGDLNVNITEIRTSITFMQKTLDGISQSAYKNIHNPVIFTQTKSPLSITDAGYEMVNHLGMYDMLNDNWDRISYFLEENFMSMNPYDIQQFCIVQATVYPEKFLKNDQIDKVKLDAYNRGLPIIMYMRVLAVLIRDRFFNEHGIDVKDVDIYGPKNVDEAALK